MNGDDVGGANRPRSLFATALTAALAALGGAAWQHWRLRRSASLESDRAEISAKDELFDFLTTGAREKRRVKHGFVIGSFRDENDVLRSIKRLRSEWPQGFEAYSPQLNEHFLEAMDLPKSRTRFWILAGAIFGQFSGWTVTIMLSIYWPHKVANMPVIAVPPFTILSFELMVLMAVIAGVCGLLYHAGMPRFDAPPEYMRSFRRDRIGIAMNCIEESQFKQAESILRDLGAEDVFRA
jgi:hypothetical protein